MPDDDPLIGYREMAERAGVKPSTLRGYRSQGRLPDPDDDTIPDRPRWRLSTFEAWMRSRPGPGTRTDLHREDDAGRGS
ncbi:MarR family transcriptional regulator [Frankia sp. CiP3]|uniref:MarR family transcriptional regulator n=1 Tax=Frankia sp. CiP3 TaxID=2880971 RepID=UPI001EF5612B|nr:MarR family transcriptional regulator [Frankia sp. CiP3]